MDLYFKLHPLTYFRAKAALCWLAQHMPGQTHIDGETSLEKRWGPIWLLLYRKVWTEEDTAAQIKAHLGDASEVLPPGSEFEICQLDLWRTHFIFELSEGRADGELYTNFALWVTT